MKGNDDMRDKIIRIHWSEPMLLEDAIQSDLAQKQGLYYITRIFGKNETSLYLGKATKNNTIKHRLISHRDNWLFKYRGKKYVRIGRIVYPKTSDIYENEKLIDHAERAILYDKAHSKLFPENIQNRKRYTSTDLYRIENEGDIFQLNSSIRMQEH